MSKFTSWIKSVFGWGRQRWQDVPEEDRRKAIEAATKAAKKLMEKKK